MTGEAPWRCRTSDEGVLFLWRATLFDKDGQWVGDIVNALGPADESVAIKVPADGVYVIQVLSEGDWTVDVQQ